MRWILPTAGTVMAALCIGALPAAHAQNTNSGDIRGTVTDSSGAVIPGVTVTVLDIDKQVLIYHRWGAASDGDLERFIIVLNFSEQDQYADVPFPGNGVWQDLLSGGQVEVANYRLASYRVPSNWGCLFWQTG